MPQTPNIGLRRLNHRLVGYKSFSLNGEIVLGNTLHNVTEFIQHSQLLCFALAIASH